MIPASKFSFSPSNVVNVLVSQKSRAAINDIELHVRQIEGTARKYYSQVELDPFLRDLEDHVRDTAGVMEGLGKELECKQVRCCGSCGT